MALPSPNGWFRQPRVATIEHAARSLRALRTLRL